MSNNKMTLLQVLQSVDAGTASEATQTAVNALRAVVEKTQPFGAKTTGNSELAAIVEAIESANDVGKLPNGLSWDTAPEWAARLYRNSKGELIWMGPFGDERFKFAYVGGHHWFSSDDRAFSCLLEIVATRPQVVEQITADQTTSSKHAADYHTQDVPAMECRQRQGTVCAIDCQGVPPEPTILIGSGWVDLSRVQNIDPLDKGTGKFRLLMVSGVYAWGDNAENNYGDVVSAWRAIRRRAVWGK